MKSSRLVLASAAIVACLMIQRTNGQFTTLINVPPDQAPSSIDSDTQLNLFDGGVIAQGFSAGEFDETNVEVNIFGGAIDAFCPGLPLLKKGISLCASL